MTAILQRRVQPITITGAVIVDASDPIEESPIGGAMVWMEQRDLTVAPAISAFSGYFNLQLPRSVVKGQLVTLQVQHSQYMPKKVQVPAGDQLYIIRLSRIQTPPPPPLGRPPIELSHLVVRYMVQARTDTNIGSGAKVFEVSNTGNVPCERPFPCSPDRRWKAAIGSVSLDAGPDNEFRNARLSCIAGPCPFTHLDSDQFSRGGRFISAMVRNWSDTATFVLEAEVVRPEVSAISQRAYPTILENRLNFSVPAAAKGVSIGAEIRGEEITFPIGPTAILSWATCEVRSETNQTKLFRCELKPGYQFKDRDHN